MRQFRQNHFPNVSRDGVVTRCVNQSEVATIGEHRKSQGRAREKAWTKDHGRYCEFHEAKGHDTIECIMLRCELENKMQSVQK